MRRSTIASARLLVGRTIVGFELRSFDVGHHRRRGLTHDPLFVLDNGSRVAFMVDETENERYGIRPLYFPATPTRKRPQRRRKTAE